MNSGVGSTMVDAEIIWEWIPNVCSLYKKVGQVWTSWVDRAIYLIFISLGVLCYTRPLLVWSYNLSAANKMKIIVASAD